MNFPQFWAKGARGDLEVWRWSLQSVAEAQRLADEAARQLAERFEIEGGFPPKQGGYYPNRPFREQVLQEMRNTKGEVCAVVTRNSYGCMVLNTARTMFVDIDLPEPRRSAGLFRRLFGKPQAASPTDQQRTLEIVETWTRRNPEWGWRVYRTRSGFRLLAIQGLVEPNSDMARNIFHFMGADPLYRRLCETQKCFRARLTPKPWRCGLNKKPARWPWADAKQETRFQQWESQYRDCAARWATCEFIRHIGNSAMDPQVEPIVKLHDDQTRAESKMALA